MQDLRHDEVKKALQSMDITLPLLETVQHDGIDLTEDVLSILTQAIDEVLSILTQAISVYFVKLNLSVPQQISLLPMPSSCHHCAYLKAFLL